jgi:hypothetical protein
MGTQDQISFAEENTTSYDLAGVSTVDIAQATKDLAVLHDPVSAWLKEIHPELLKDDSTQV